MNNATAIVIGAGVSSASAVITSLLSAAIQARAQRRANESAEQTALLLAIGEFMSAVDAAVIDHGILNGTIKSMFNDRRRRELLDRVSQTSTTLRLTAPDNIVELVERHGAAIDTYIEDHDLEAFKRHRDEARRDFRAALNR